AAAGLIVAVDVGREGADERNPRRDIGVLRAAAAAIELKIDGARRERPREERDQTTHRPVAVQTGRAAFDDLDVIEHRLGYATPIDPLTPRVVDRHAVEEHRGAALVDAANRDDLRRSANQAALPRQLDGRQLAQEILRFTRGTLLHLLGR